ncbi:hypothetical protein TrVGV298_012248 [Trichoderma virens]|nr:hypothetical protein TrVGV298_012248 [Trichoderma virens]
MKEAFAAHDSSFRERDDDGLAKLQRIFEGAKKKYLEKSTAYDKIGSLKAQLQSDSEKPKLEQSTPKDKIRNLGLEKEKANDTRKAEIDGEITTKKAIRLAILEGVVGGDLEKKLGNVSVPARGLPSAIIDIDKDRNIIHADESEIKALPGSDLGKDEGVDVWSKSQ